MMRSYIITIMYLLAYNAAAYADDRDKTMFAATTPDLPRWQDTSTALLPKDYERLALNNQRIVQERLQTYSGRVLSSSGTYTPAVILLGSAIVLAANDRRYHLNDSKTVGLLLKDTARSNRSLLLEYRKAW